MSTVGCEPGELKVYDSLFDDVDDSTKWKMEKTFASKIKFISCKVQKQKGLKDCGLFAVAFATSIAYAQSFEFDQSKMRIHLIECLKKQRMIELPIQCIACILYLEVIVTLQLIVIDKLN